MRCGHRSTFLDGGMAPATASSRLRSSEVIAINDFASSMSIAEEKVSNFIMAFATKTSSASKLSLFSGSLTTYTNRPTSGWYLLLHWFPSLLLFFDIFILGELTLGGPKQRFSIVSFRRIVCLSAPEITLSWPQTEKQIQKVLLTKKCKPLSQKIFDSAKQPCQPEGVSGSLKVNKMGFSVTKVCWNGDSKNILVSHKFPVKYENHRTTIYVSRPYFILLQQPETLSLWDPFGFFIQCCFLLTPEKSNSNTQSHLFRYERMTQIVEVQYLPIWFSRRSTRAAGKNQQSVDYRNPVRPAKAYCLWPEQQGLSSIPWRTADHVAANHPSESSTWDPRSV